MMTLELTLQISSAVIIPKTGRDFKDLPGQNLFSHGTLARVYGRSIAREDERRTRRQSQTWPKPAPLPLPLR